MVTNIRSSYNGDFSTEKYQEFLSYIYNKYNHKPSFRIGETPVFVSKDLKEKLFAACEEIADVICQDNFKELTVGAVSDGQYVPNEDAHTTFLQMDFGICIDENGELIPQLIEAQGFPSLYFFQHLLAKAYSKYFDIPSNYSHLFGDLDDTAYLALLKKVIVGNSKPENVVLLEIEPSKQTTQIDFLATQDVLGIKVLCVSDLKVDGKDLYYLDDRGERVAVHKIYNRVIFDELVQRDDLKRTFQFTEEVNVEWIGHPNWFFRISKYTLPFLKSQYVPDTFFLEGLEKYPEDLENYVLKPLYSFAGAGVKLHITAKDLDKIEDRKNYILQKKVSYAPLVQTPDIPAKCEIRMLMLWEKEAARPRIINNLARLSKGEMIGVRYNKDKEWVGASVCFFEK